MKVKERVVCKPSVSERLIVWPFVIVCFTDCIVLWTLQNHSLFLLSSLTKLLISTNKRQLHAPQLISTHLISPPSFISFHPIPAPISQRNTPYAASTTSPFSPFSSSPQTLRAAADTSTSRSPRPTYSLCKTTGFPSASQRFRAQIAISRRTDSDTESISPHSTIE